MSQLILLLVACFLFTCVGAIVGGFAGLLPGMHPNSIAALCVAIVPSFGGDVVIIVSVLSFLVGVMMSHSICEIIPTAMLGASSEEDAAVLLPSQRLFQSGEHKLLFSSIVAGVFWGLILFALVMIPTRCILGPPIQIYSSIRQFMGPILIAICALSLWRCRNSGILICLLEFIGSGVFGILVLDLEIPGLMSASIFGDAWPCDPSTYLLPAFSGFFAMPSLIIGIPAAVNCVNRSNPRKRKSSSMLPALRSFVPSMLVGWLPGMTNAYATSLSISRKRRGRDRIVDSSDYLVTYVATGIGGTLQSIIALSTISRARNGTLEAVGGLVGMDEVLWDEILSPPLMLSILLIAAAISSIAGALLCIRLGPLVFKMDNARMFCAFRRIVLSFIVLIVLLLSGPIGLLVLATAACMGTAFLLEGAPRIHLVGFLLIPVISFYLMK